MGDDGDPAREVVDEALQPVEAVEVEVVRRLVEEQQVEPREQDRGQRGARCLPAGERCRLLLQRDRQAELGADRPRPGLEVCATESEEPLQRRSVGVRAPVSRVPLDRGLRVGDARASREVGQQRLAGPAVVLLRQVADGQRGGRPLDCARVRLVEAGGEPEQRRLACPVGADEAEPRARPERQVDAVENGTGAERADDACE